MNTEQDDDSRIFDGSYEEQARDEMLAAIDRKAEHDTAATAAFEVWRKADISRRFTGLDRTTFKGGFAAGEQHWRAAERQRIRAILDFYPDISAQALMNAAEETLP